MPNLTEEEFSAHLDEKLFRKKNYSLDINASDLQSSLYTTMASQLALLFSANWGFKGLESFAPLSQKMMLQAFAKYGSVGLYKDTKPLKNFDGTEKASTRYVPYYVVPITYNELTGTILTAWGIPLVMTNGKNIFAFNSAVEKQQASTFEGAMQLDSTNCAFMSFGFSFAESFGLIPRVHSLIVKWSFAQGVLINNLQTSQNKYYADSASPQKVAYLNSQLTQLSKPVISGDSLVRKDDNNAINSFSGTTITPIPFQNTSIAELSAVAEIFKRETFEMYGIRQNKDFKKERQIAGEIAGQELTQTMVEELVEPFLQKFASELSDLSSKKVELVDELAIKQAEVEGIIPNENAKGIPTIQEIEQAKQHTEQTKKPSPKGDE